MAQDMQRQAEQSPPPEHVIDRLYRLENAVPLLSDALPRGEVVELQPVNGAPIHILVRGLEFMGNRALLKANIMQPGSRGLGLEVWLLITSHDELTVIAIGY